MELLTSATIAGFMKRFANCDDGVLESVCVRFSQGVREIAVTVKVYEMNADQPDPAPRRIRLVLGGASEYRMEDKGIAAIEVLNSGIHICWFGFIIGLELGDLLDSPETIDELRTSKMYALGNWLGWELA